MRPPGSRVGLQVCSDLVQVRAGILPDFERVYFTLFPFFWWTIATGPMQPPEGCRTCVYAYGRMRTFQLSGHFLLVLYQFLVLLSFWCALFCASMLDCVSFPILSEFGLGALVGLAPGSAFRTGMHKMHQCQATYRFSICPFPPFVGTIPAAQIAHRALASAGNASHSWCESPR